MSGRNTVNIALEISMSYGILGASAHRYLIHDRIPFSDDTAGLSAGKRFAEEIRDISPELHNEAADLWWDGGGGGVGVGGGETICMKSKGFVFARGE